MGLCNVAITGASITPNPVNTGKQFIISISVSDVTFVIGESSYYLSDSNGFGILAPDHRITMINTGNENEILVELDGSIIEILEE